MSPTVWELWRSALVLAALPDGEGLRPGGARGEDEAQAWRLAELLLARCEAALPGLGPLPPVEWQRARVPLWLQRLAMREERPLQLGLGEVGLPDCPTVLVAWEGQDPRRLVAVSSQLEET